MNEKGETRRERNSRHEVPSPDFIIPEAGEQLWEWYHEISNGLKRVEDGVCYPISWSEILAWQQISSVIVSTDEFKILRSMDLVFCEETNKELQDYYERTKKGE